MGSQFINGAKWAVSSALAAAVPITAITNAAEAVASTATPGAVGDIVVLASGWGELDETVARVSAIAAGVSMTLEEIDTSDVARFPAGEGAGAFNKVNGFTSLSQVRDVKQAGGDPQFFKWKYVDDPSGRQRQRPTGKDAITKTIQMDYDHTKPWYALLKQLDRAGDPVVLRETLPNASGVIYYYGYVSFNGAPTTDADENQTVTLTLALIAEPIRYDAV